jgi:thiosulfate/3-mercaptopyruvate sulfurtransferase
MPYGLASSTMLVGVSAARRIRVKPASRSTAVRRASPAWAPSASPTSCARDAGVQLVDNRPAKQYEGEDKHPAARAAGTIPNSINLQQGQLVQDGTAFVVDREKLQALMDQAGVSGDGETITFCNTGHWAATGWFTLSELAGLDNVAMYDGSMTEWSQDENRPLQTASSGLGAVYEWLFD